MRTLYCYAHKLNLVLIKVSENISAVKIFFSHLRAFSKFTSSTKRKALFRKYNISIPSLCKTRWYYRTRTVSAIKLGRYPRE